MIYIIRDYFPWLQLGSDSVLQKARWQIGTTRVLGNSVRVYVVIAVLYSEYLREGYVFIAPECEPCGPTIITQPMLNEYRAKCIEEDKRMRAIGAPGRLIPQHCHPGFALSSQPELVPIASPDAAQSVIDAKVAEIAQRDRVERMVTV